MMATTKKKKKLLPVKELRALVDLQQNGLGNLRLQLHERKEELKSMTGARDNCKTMLEHTEGLLKTEKEKSAELQTLVKTLRGDRERAEFLMEQANKALSAERGMTALNHLKKAVSIVKNRVCDWASNLVARYRFK